MFARTIGLRRLSQAICSSTGYTRSVTAPRIAMFCSDHSGSMTFREAGVSEARLAQLKSLGLESMFPIQQETYQPIVEGKDVIGRAKTGTGKTVAFVLPLIERLKSVRPVPNSPSILILAPTRELAVQVSREVEKLDPRLRSVCVYGGASMRAQESQLSKPVDIVVGTPGRTIHFIQERILNLDNVEAFVLDEADQMLDIGFKQEIEEIISSIPAERQTLLFSATMPPWIRGISNKYMKNPQVIDLIGNRKTPDKVSHFAVKVSTEQQRMVSIALLLRENLDSGKCLIFVDTKMECSEIADDPLLRQCSSIRAIHGDISQRERARTLDDFRTGRVKVLVATDVAARGLDIPGVDVVINLRPPKNTESYIHRSGRGGRAGKLGKSFILCCGSEERRGLQPIERESGTPFALYAPKRESVTTEKDTITKTLLSTKPAIIDTYQSWAKELSDQMGAEKALAAALSIVSNKAEGDKQFSLLSGATGMTTIEITSDTELLSKVSVRDMLKSAGIAGTSLEETVNGSFVIDLDPTNLALLKNTFGGSDRIAFEPLSTVPLLKFESAAPSYGVGGYRRGRDSDRGNRRGGYDRGGRDYDGGDRRAKGGYRSGGGRDFDRGDRGNRDRGFDRGGRGGYDRGGRNYNEGGNRDRRGDRRGGYDRGDNFQNKEKLDFDFLFDT